MYLCTVVLYYAVKLYFLLILAVNLCLIILVVNLCLINLVVNLYIVLVHCCTMLCDCVHNVNARTPKIDNLSACGM